MDDHTDDHRGKISMTVPTLKTMTGLHFPFMKGKSSALVVTLNRNTAYLVRCVWQRGVFACTHTDTLLVPSPTDPQQTAQAVAVRFTAWKTETHDPARVCILALDQPHWSFSRFIFPFQGRRQIDEVLPHEFALEFPFTADAMQLAPFESVPLAPDKHGVGVSVMARAQCLAWIRAFSAQGFPLTRLCTTTAAHLYTLEHANASTENTWGILDACPADAGSNATGNAGSDATGNAGSDATIHTLMRGNGVLDHCVVRGATLHRADSPSTTPDLAQRLALQTTLPDSQGFDAQGLWCSPELSTHFSESEARTLAKITGLPVRPLHFDPLVDPVYGPGMALAHETLTHSTNKGQTFLNHELTPQQTRPLYVSLVRYSAFAACLILFLLCVQDAASLYRSSQALRPLQQAVFKGYREILPDVPATSPLPQMEAVMQERLRQWQGQTENDGTPPSATFLALLKEIMTRVGPNVFFDSLTLNDNTLKIQGTAPNYEAADATRVHLAGIPFLTNVRLLGATRESNKTRVRFEVEALCERQ